MRAVFWFGETTAVWACLPYNLLEFGSDLTHLEKTANSWTYNIFLKSPPFPCSLIPFSFVLVLQFIPEDYLWASPPISQLCLLPGEGRWVNWLMPLSLLPDALAFLWQVSDLASCPSREKRRKKHFWKLRGEKGESHWFCYPCRNIPSVSSSVIIWFDLTSPLGFYNSYSGTGSTACLPKAPQIQSLWQRSTVFVLPGYSPTLEIMTDEAPSLSAFRIGLPDTILKTKNNLEVF